MSRQISEQIETVIRPSRSNSSEYMSSKSNIGAFSRIPGEIRNHIWKNLTSQGVCILQTCRQLKSESEPLLFNERIVIHLEPNPTRSWALVDTPSKSWEFRDFQAAKRQKIPYEKFQGIDIILHSPISFYMERMGQFICLWHRARQLISLLQNPESPCRLSNLTLIFLGQDFGATSWMERGSPRNTFRDIPSGGDVESMLLLFATLRNVGNVKVVAAENAIRWKIQDFSKALQRTHPFGKGGSKRSRWRFHDTNLEYLYNYVWCELDQKMDNLSSVAASHLRLERFANWFQDGGYRSEYLQRFTAHYSQCEVSMAMDLRKLKHRVEHMHQYMMDLNPMSNNMQTMRQSWLLPPGKMDEPPYCDLKRRLSWSIMDQSTLLCYQARVIRATSSSFILGQDFGQEEAAKNVQEKMADRKEWLEYYPAGIPSFNEWERKFWIERYGKPNRCSKKWCQYGWWS